MMEEEAEKGQIPESMKLDRLVLPEARDACQEGRTGNRRSQGLPGGERPRDSLLLPRSALAYW